MSRFVGLPNGRQVHRTALAPDPHSAKGHRDVPVAASSRPVELIVRQEQRGYRPAEPHPHEGEPRHQPAGVVNLTDDEQVEVAGRRCTVGPRDPAVCVHRGGAFAAERVDDREVDQGGHVRHRVVGAVAVRAEPVPAGPARTLDEAPFLEGGKRRLGRSVGKSRGVRDAHDRERSGWVQHQHRVDPRKRPRKHPGPSDRRDANRHDCDGGGGSHRPGRGAPVADRVWGRVLRRCPQRTGIQSMAPAATGVTRSSLATPAIRANAVSVHAICTSASCAAATCAAAT